jgi:hypothetical protein
MPSGLNLYVALLLVLDELSADIMVELFFVTYLASSFLSWGCAGLSPYRFASG